MQSAKCEAWRLYYCVSHDTVNTINFCAMLDVDHELEAGFRVIHDKLHHPYCSAMLNFYESISVRLIPA